MPTSLQGRAQQAESHKGYRFRNLYGMLDEDFLKQCWRDIRKDAAAGVDQVSAQAYAQHLDANIHDLVERLKQKRYRAKLVRRQSISKGGGTQRPLGIPAVEDKLLQLAVAGASQIDASAERLIKDRSDTYGVNITAATFPYFREPNGSALLARVFLLEPAQVELQSRTQGVSKRRPNLTYDALDAIAAAQGVQALYHDAVTNLERYCQKHTTRSALVFTGVCHGKRNAVVSVIPQERNARDGLRFQLYSLRLRTWWNLAEDAALAMLPSRREPWIDYETAGSDDEGLQGFFANRAESEPCLEGLTRPQKTGTT